MRRTIVSRTLGQLLLRFYCPNTGAAPACDILEAFSAQSNVGNQ